MILIKSINLIILALIIVQICLVGCGRVETEQKNRNSEETSKNSSKINDFTIPQKIVERENSADGLTNGALLEKELIELKNKLDHNEKYRVKVITDSIEGDKIIEELYSNGTALEYKSFSIINPYLDNENDANMDIDIQMYSDMTISEIDGTNLYYLVSEENEVLFFSSERT